MLRPLGYFTDQSRADGILGGRPILMVHGYLHDSSAWIFLKRHLRRLGFGPIYTMNLGYPFHSICNYAEDVASKAKTIQEQTGRNDLVLIGHSMGGLVNAWYATKIALSEKPLSVITIGSPLAGTHMANIALGENGKQMRRGSSFVHALQQELKKNDRIPFYHIASKSDQIVLPYSSAITGLHPEREYILENVGHMSLLMSPRVASKISTWMTF